MLGTPALLIFTGPLGWCLVSRAVHTAKNKMVKILTFLCLHSRT